MIVDYKKVFCIVLSAIILTQSFYVVFPAATEASDLALDSTPAVSSSLYLRYEENVYIRWDDWGMNMKVGEVVRKVSVVEVQDENFTVQEDLTYTMHLPSDLDYAYVLLEYMDGHMDTLAEGEASSIDNPYVASIYVHYVVNKTNGKILKIWKDDEADTPSEIPLELELYWSYWNSTGNRQEYAWDVYGFDSEGDVWRYSVTPQMEKDDTFNEWTVESANEFSLEFDNIEQGCMNLSRTWKDQSDDEVFADWKSYKWCDNDTGVMFMRRWIGECKFDVWDEATDEWSLEEGFTIDAQQTLANTNFKLTVPDEITILSPKQGQFLGDKIKIEIEVNDPTTPSWWCPKFYAKQSSSEGWHYLGSYDGLGYIPCSEERFTFPVNGELDISGWKGKCQIKAVKYDYINAVELGFDIVDVYVKPVCIGTIKASGLHQYSYGPHNQGGLNRIPFEVDFDIAVRQWETADANMSILIDCWYLPLNTSMWSEDLQRTFFFEEWWGGSAAAQAIFKTIYAEESGSVDPLVGTQALKYLEIPTETYPYVIRFVSGGTYTSQAYQYTIVNQGTERKSGTVGNNNCANISLREGDTVSFKNGLYFINPPYPNIRLYSLDVFITYDITIDGETRTIVEHAQKTIGIRHIDPVDTPATTLSKKFSEALSINTLLGYTIESILGKEYAQAAYEGNYVKYLYDLALGIDTLITITPILISIYGILTGPWWAAALGVISLATGVPIPTSYADLVNEFNARAYGSVPKEDRVYMWFTLIKFSMGVDDSDLINTESVTKWASIVTLSAEGTPLNATLEVAYTPYSINGDYYMQLDISNPSPYDAHFIRVYLEGQQPSIWTKHHWPTSWTNGKYITIKSMEDWQFKVEDIDKSIVDPYIGKDESTWKLEVYFLSEINGAIPPIFSIKGEEGCDNPKFKVPVVSEVLSALSPVDLHVYDQYGRHVGLNATGGVDMEIPGAVYSGSDASPETVILSDPSLEYRYEVVGDEGGQFDLQFLKPMQVNDTEGEAWNIVAELSLTEVTINSGEVYSYKYDFDKINQQVNNLTTQGWGVNGALDHVISSLDTDGDGTPDVTDDNPTEVFDLAHTVTFEADTYSVRTLTNSTVMSFTFNQTLKQISFDVAGPSDTQSFCNVTIPKSLLKGDPWTIALDDVPTTDFTIIENTTHTSLYFAYTHGSSRHVTIQGTWVIPENNLMILSFLAVLISATLGWLIQKHKTRAPDKKHAIRKPYRSNSNNSHGVT